MKISIPFDLDKVKSKLSLALEQFMKKLPVDQHQLKKWLPLGLGLVLCLVMVIGLVCCSGGNTSDSETAMYIIAVDNLDVHKKANASSKVLGQLPLDFEVEVLEQQATNEAIWGRIDEVTLSDGTKIKAGWIDLEGVRLPGDPAADDETEPSSETPAEPVPAPVTVNMGTVTAGKLNVRKGPDSKYETNGAYYKGDRIEILETQTADDTVWGRTNLGWVGMGYVRMDGATPDSDESNPIASKIISNGNTTVLGYGVVNLGELNVRLGPGTDHDKIGTVERGIRYAYYQVSSTTDNWVRIEDGWVSTEYFYLEGTTTENAFSGTVTTDDLNVRTGPDTSFQSIAKLQQGDTVEILAKVGSWGYTGDGWVFMTYIEANEPTYSTGTVTVTRGLNIRQEPNADSEKVGELVEGNVVTILEVEGGWGKTVQGWINLKYVKYDSIG